MGKRLVGFPLLGMTVGFLGARQPFRNKTATMLCITGGFAGLFNASSRSQQRLMGFTENSREVELYGCLSPEEVNAFLHKETRPITYSLIDAGRPGSK